jgi:hypothetical protein
LAKAKLSCGIQDGESPLLSDKFGGERYLYAGRVIWILVILLQRYHTSDIRSTIHRQAVVELEIERPEFVKLETPEKEI